MKKKVKHQRPGDLDQDIKKPTKKWKDVNVDFVTGLTRIQK